VTLLPSFTAGKGPWYPLDRRLGGPQSWSDTEARGKNPSLCVAFVNFALQYFKTRVIRYNCTLVTHTLYS
jgi:hypothetical protein